MADMAYLWWYRGGAILGATMGAFKELDPDVVLKLLEGQQDLLTPELKKEEALFRNTSCPTCGARGLEAVINEKRPFNPGVPLPNRFLRCICGTDFDPYTRLVLSVGSG
jgi:hypothetical protein